MLPYSVYVDEAKIMWKSFKFIFPDIHQAAFKNVLEKFNASRF